MKKENKILLIGNGPGALAKELGSVIDSFAGPVVRFNDYRISGYEFNVGSRVDIWITVERYTPIKWSHHRSIFSSFNPQPHNPIYQRLKTECPGLEYFPKEVLDETIRISGYETPSTGAIAATYFSQFYNTVYLYGFDHFNAADHHYSRDGHVAGKMHKADPELLYFRKMRALGRVEYLDPESEPRISGQDLTVIIPYLNEGQEVARTVESIYETSDPGSVKVMAVDDKSGAMSMGLEDYPYLERIRNKNRLGVDGCRTLGGYLARTKYIMLLDAHCRFIHDDWAGQILAELRRSPQAILSPVSIFLKQTMKDMNGSSHMGVGARLNLTNEKDPRQILEPKWRLKAEDNNEPVQDLQIPLGGAYAMSAEWFKYIKGLEGLRTWGSSETLLGLKSWMAGGSVKYMSQVRVGHIYRDATPYPIPWPDLIYNKILLCMLLLDPKSGATLINEIPESQAKSQAMEMIGKNIAIIQEMRKEFIKIQVISFEDLMERWDIAIPEPPEISSREIKGQEIGTIELN